MRVEFSGEFRTLQRFEKKLETAGPQVLHDVGKQLAEEAIGLVREGFERSEDPYGKPWAPPMLRHGRPLEDTGGLKASWFVVSSGPDGFEIANAKEYSKYHQEGTGLFGPNRHKILPVTKHALKLPGGLFFRSVKGSKPRKMVPDDGDLPPRWIDRFVEVADEVLSDHFNSP